MLEGNSRYKFRLEGEELETEVVVKQTILFEVCPYGPARPPLGQALSLNVHRNFIIFDAKEQIVRYGCTAKISPSGVGRVALRLNASYTSDFVRHKMRLAFSSG